MREKDSEQLALDILISKRKITFTLLPMDFLRSKKSIYDSIKPKDNLIIKKYTFILGCLISGNNKLMLAIILISSVIVRVLYHLMICIPAYH